METICLLSRKTKQKISDILKFACKWIELEKKHPDEVIQKDEYCVYSLISGYQL